MTIVHGRLGRTAPPDFDHVAKHPYRPVHRGLVHAEQTVHVDEALVPIYDQGDLEACTGFSSTWAMSILHDQHEFDPVKLWEQAKLEDAFPENNAASDNAGSTVRAAMHVLRTKGHVPSTGTDPKDEGLEIAADSEWIREDGVTAYHWATTVDQIRAAVSSHGGRPVVFGINWYAAFDAPETVNGEHWIGRYTTNLGAIEGGHAICCTGVSDQRQAVQLTNSWGPKYPQVWLPYHTVEQLLSEDGECAVMTPA